MNACPYSWLPCCASLASQRREGNRQRAGYKIITRRVLWSHKIKQHATLEKVRKWLHTYASHLTLPHFNFHFILSMVKFCFLHFIISFSSRFSFCCRYLFEALISCSGTFSYKICCSVLVIVFYMLQMSVGRRDYFFFISLTVFFGL